MLLSKPLCVLSTVMATFFASNSLAQQDGKTLFKQCLLAQTQEFKPLMQERDAVYQKFSNRSTSIRNIVFWLENDHKTADSKRLQKIAALEAQLETLKKYAKLTNAEAIKDVDATAETANVLLEEISDEGDAAIKPFARKLSALQRKYIAQETKLKPAVIGLFREQGNSNSTSGLARNYDSFSYSSGTASATYVREGGDKSAAICYIYLFNDKVGKQQYGLFLGKYPIAYQNKNQLEVLVGDTRVTINSAEKDLGGEQLNATLLSLVDFEKLEAMLAP